MSLTVQSEEVGAPMPAGIIPREEVALAGAFARFSEVAASLEQSYGKLQGEVTGLRFELEASNRGLARSLEENRRMRQHLDRILDALPCGVLVTEADGSVSIANPESRRLCGLKMKMKMETPASGILQRNHISSPLKRILAHTLPQGPEQQHRLSTEEPLEANDQATTWIAVRRAELESPDGGSSIFIMRDISEAKRMEQEREALRRREALVEISALLAHEIRNPLGSLELFAGLLASSEIVGEGRTWVEHMQAGLRTLGATVNNVLHFHAQPAPGLAPTDLGKVLETLLEFLGPLAQRCGVKVQLRQKLGGVQVAADRHRVEQVMLNLALNAFRAMPQGGTLRITGRICQRSRTKAWAVIEVSDSGPGIKAENRERIFTAGFSTQPGSPGLGLAVCKTIVEQHGGSIVALNNTRDSIPRGAKFRLQLPMPERSGLQ